MGLQTGSDVAVAFALVLGAGLSTIIGAGFVFCAKLADSRILAASLGLSSGVMMYVSFLEIIVKSIQDFENEGYSSTEANRWSTLCFFGGMGITALIDMAVHKFASYRAEKKKSKITSDLSILDSASQLVKTSPPLFGGDDVEAGTQVQPPKSASEMMKNNPEAIQKKDLEDSTKAEVPEDAAEIDSMIEKVMALDEHQFHLQKLGLISGLAIALHNFPEGLATFVSTLADKVSGAGIAFAIAIHNIPEGIVVAMPVYYATKSKAKAFFWAFLSGLSEPIGGLLGWVVLSNMPSIIYAIMFGIVAGMMVYIPLKDLIPSALRFDHEDKHVTKWTVIGMIVMALSLRLFEET